MDKKTSVKKLPLASKVSENDEEIVKCKAEIKSPVASIVICDNSVGNISKASSENVIDVLDVTSERDIPHAVLFIDCQFQYLSLSWWNRPIHRKMPKITPFILCLALVVTCCTFLAKLSFYLGKREGNMNNAYDGNTTNPLPTISISPTPSPSSAIASLWKPIGQNIQGYYEEHNFGEVVSLSRDGSVLAIGSKSGTYIYKLDNDVWNQMGGHLSHCTQYVKNNNKTDLLFDRNNEITHCNSINPSGFDVVISADGNRILHGAAFSDYGYASVYDFDALKSNWNQLGNTMSGERPSDRFGYLLDFSAKGDRAVILSSTGEYIDIYDLTTTQMKDSVINTWNKTYTIYEDIPWRKDARFLSLSGNGKFIATRSVYIGIVIYTQQESSSTWEKTGNIAKMHTNELYTISLSERGDRVAIGAPHNNAFGPYVGYVRVYEFYSNETSWRQIGDTLFAKEYGSQSGFSVALSGDGNRIIFGSIGKILDTSNEQRSKVHIFDFINDVWVQVGPKILADTTNNAFGSSVSISSNGKRAAVGAPLSDCINIKKCGVVHVYEFDAEN